MQDIFWAANFGVAEGSKVVVRQRLVANELPAGRYADYAGYA